MTPDSVHLLTRSSQMTLCKDEQGRVRRAYYGPRLHQPEDALENAADAPLLYSSLADSVTGLPNASGEYCICVTQADGALSLSLECQGWEVLELDDDREEAVFYGKDPSYPVRVEIHVRSHRESDTFLQWAVVRNEGKEGIRLHRAASAQLGLRAERYFVTSFRGTWGGESLMSEEEVARGHELALVSGTGTRTAQEGSPGFIISLDGPAREDSGEVVLGALAWSGNYRIWFRHSPYHYLFAGAGLDTAPAPYLLDGGGVFETPPLILTHSKNGKGEASRRIHCWARRYGLRGGGTERPTLLNSWEGVYFTFTEKVLHGMMKRAADLGIELFVLDDGWFAGRDNDRAGLGDYTVNRKKLPEGLEGLSRHLKDRGLSFGLWFEPESVNPDSDLYRAHPDWALTDGFRPVLGRNQLLLDLTKPEVRDYIVENVSRILDSTGISYVKWDMNRHSVALGAKAHDFVLGLYDVLRRIFAPRPDILLEGCSSGGNRFDLGMLCFSPQIWASDDTDPIERLTIQNGISYLYPQSAVGAHVSAAPHAQTLRNTPLNTRGNVAFFGCLGYELDLRTLLPVEIKEIQGQIAFYKRYREVFQFGTFRRTELGWQVSDGKVTLAGVFHRLVNAAPCYERLRVKGLKQETDYRVTSLAQAIRVGQFGNLLKHVAPVNVNPNGALLRIADRHITLPGKPETLTASGAALAAGIMLSPLFRGTGYAPEQRTQGDFGSDVYLIEEIGGE